MASLYRRIFKRYAILNPRLILLVCAVIGCFTIYIVLLHSERDIRYFPVDSFVQLRSHDAKEPVQRQNSIDQPNGDQKQLLQQLQQQRESLKKQNGEILQQANNDDSMTQHFNEDVVNTFIGKYRLDFNYTLPPGVSPWEVPRKWATSRELLPDQAPELGAVLNMMATARITEADDPGRHTGNQLKLLLTLEGRQQVLFKPKWNARGFVWSDNLCNVHDIPYAEIAAFHLSRVLGFRRTPLAVGRVLKLSKEILPAATDYLRETVYNVPEANATCIYGHCYTCSKSESSWVDHLCTSDDTLEGVMILWMPEHLKLNEDYKDTHPWMRICYEREEVMDLLRNTSHCSAVQNSISQPPLYSKTRTNPFYNNSALFLDLIDASIFQYIINNADRKVSVMEGPDSVRSFVMMDNGKSFQNPHGDERLILAPLFQCCMVRQTTYERLRVLEKGVLSSVMREVLKADPVSPVLTDPHLTAMDRRLAHVILEIQECARTQGPSHVFR
ncbi:glycosaminoglycan xylosylkinase-like isoform X2 [Littorina saxatilis]|uniref:FAM20 C-terminal domain-containing protein n=1 Tax=Littorina saxatilis TaxID=31220 RepID=A0AAN9C1W7_9CAEN